MHHQPHHHLHHEHHQIDINVVIILIIIIIIIVIIISSIIIIIIIMSVLVSFLVFVSVSSCVAAFSTFTWLCFGFWCFATVSGYNCQVNTGINATNNTNAQNLAGLAYMAGNVMFLPTQATCKNRRVRRSLQGMPKAQNSNIARTGLRAVATVWGVVSQRNSFGKEHSKPERRTALFGRCMPKVSSRS